MTDSKLTADVREMKYAGYGQHSQPILRDGLLFADVYGKDQGECEDNAADVLQAVNSHSELVKALEAAEVAIGYVRLSYSMSHRPKKKLTPDEQSSATEYENQVQAFIEQVQAALTAAGGKR